MLETFAANARIRRALRGDFVRHGALVFGATMAVNILNYVFNFAVSRRLGVEGFAVLSSLGGGLMILSLPAIIANLIIIKYASEFHAVDDQGRLSRLTRVVLRWAALFAGGFLIVGLALRRFIASFLHVSNDAVIVLTVVLIALGLVAISIRGLLQGAQNFRKFSISVVLEILLKVLLGVTLVYAGFGVGGALLGWSVGTGTALVYTIWAVRRAVYPSDPAHLLVDPSRLVKTVSGVAAATATLTLLSFLDVVLVKHYFDSRQAGLYAAVNLTGKVVLFVVSFLPLTLLPKAAAKAKRGESPAGLLLQAAAGTFLISGAVLATFALMPVTIIGLIAGRAFTAAAPYVLRYDTAMIMLAGVTLVVNYKIALHRFDFVYPLVAILIAEVGAIAVWHRGIGDVVNILLVGNAIALLAVMYRVNSNQSALAGHNRASDEAVANAGL